MAVKERYLRGILACIIAFNPYVFCVFLVVYYILTLVITKREKKRTEEWREVVKRAMYAQELMRAECPGKEENTEEE